MKRILFALAIAIGIASCGSTGRPSTTTTDTVCVDQDTTHVEADSVRTDSIK